MKASEFLSKEEQQSILQAIKQAEKDSSGEVRVHLENKCPGDVLDRAAEIFAHLKMHKTDQRNGILFYLAIENKKFAVIGDVGINKVVPEGFWDSIKESLRSYFVEGKFAKGLEVGILMTGEKLKTYFPHQADDVNELPDDISFGK